MRLLNLLYRASYVLLALVIAAGNLLAYRSAVAAPTISTFAGGENGPMLGTTMNPKGLAIDAAGNLFVADSVAHRIRKISPNGMITTVVGIGGGAGFVDGPVATAKINTPGQMAFDASGNLFFIDGLRIRKLDSAGVISTVAGNGTAGSAGDGGPATTASMDPAGFAVSASGEIYIADFSGHRIRRVASNGIITAFAGTGVAGFSGDGGAAINAQFTNPTSLALKADGTLFVTDNFRRVRRIFSDGTIATFAGDGVSGNEGDGEPATSARFRLVTSLSVDASGRLYISDYDSNRVRRVTPDGDLILTFAGGGVPLSSDPYSYLYNLVPDGVSATSVYLFRPDLLALDATGNVFISSYTRIHSVNPTGLLTNVAFVGGFGIGDGGSATGASLVAPTSLAFDKYGRVFVSDRGHEEVRKMITPDGVISSIRFRTQYASGPSGLAVDKDGSVYIAAWLGNSVRKFSPNVLGPQNSVGLYYGLFDDIIGSSDSATAGFSGDGGSARQAQLSGPWGLALDAARNLYIADAFNHRIRRVSPDGIITTLVGNGTAGFGGDNGPATLASLNFPYGIGVDPSGNLWIADYANHRIRRVGADGKINTVAGTGVAGFSGDGGAALSAQLSNPISVKFDTKGNAYVAEYTGHRVRKIAVDGTISTVAGNGVAGFAGDGGVATSANLNGPTDAAVDAYGNFLIADYGNNRIRKVSGLVPGKVVNDLNGDGKSDLILRNASTGQIDAYLMDGISVASAATLMSPGSGWSITHLADINGDGKADILWRHTDGRVAAWLMDGLSSTTSALLMGAGSGWRITHAADLNGDGKADIIWQHTDGRIAAWLMNGTTPTASGVLLGAGTGYSISHVVDFSGDGKADILLRGADGSVVLWLVNGLIVVTNTVLVGGGTGFSVTHAVDSLLNSGDTQLFWKNSAGVSLSSYMNIRKYQTFDAGPIMDTGAVIQNAGSGWSITHTSDINGDKSADIMWQHTDGSVAAWTTNADTRRFTNGTTIMGPGTGWSIAQIADFNGDNKSDIVWKHTDGRIAIWQMAGFAVTGTSVIVGPGANQVVPTP
jgi:sugar lactone lactonase YvrE